MNGLSTAANCLGQYYEKFAAHLTEAEITQLELLSYKLEHRVIEIAVFGVVSTGKTTLLNALLGKKIGATSPLHGTTQGLATQTWAIKAGGGKAQIRFIDTPGLDEIDGAQRSALTFAVADRVDVILFVAAGDLNPMEVAALQGLQQRQKPILLVINKADLYLEPDKAALRQAILAKLTMTDTVQGSDASLVQEIIFTAAAPLPRLVRHEYNDGSAAQESWENTAPDVRAAQEKIIALLNYEGKDLVALNVMRELAQIQNSVSQRQQKSVAQCSMATLGTILGLSTWVVLSPWQWLDGLGCELGGVLLYLGLVGRYLLPKRWLWGLVMTGLSCGVALLPWLTLGAGENLIANQRVIDELMHYWWGILPQNITKNISLWFTPQNSLEILWLIVALPLWVIGIRSDVQRLVHHPQYGAQTMIQKILLSWRSQPHTVLGKLAQGKADPGK